ncbi:hypothetical protein E8P82_12990 [Arthrobacter echini]|uniref:Flagellar protein FlbD n=1 Tax=Arthrobacter echini TaxID=1529066 RepID=A0A4S5E133_9MICC|nr:flagellar FlbD family protein [Arthrobacter echini]THJ65041.1 hypothetical protein E8P82_12990 [Arthrobacter echini]
MIVVTRLNESQFAVNPDLIERIHENPDTTLVMADGAKYIVTESLHEVIDLIAAYRARIVSLARFVAPDDTGDPAATGDHTAQRSLGVVRGAGPDQASAEPPDDRGATAPVPFRPRNT